ncbi:MAG: YqaA family protein [Gammaproteobacteria bacterium]|nr:YqaA family protein [Gammaproteobacteria bacterium]
MHLFSALYTRVMRWSTHPRAPWYLTALSFSESSFFPVPPDVMLAPMALAQPDRAWHFATLTLVASVLGGLLGYVIGYTAFTLIEPVLHQAGYWELYLRAHDWFQRWGFWAIFIAAFTPIPYKMFTIAAGVIAMALLPFVIASLIGRGARFFLVAALMVWGGVRMQRMLLEYIDRIGWTVVLLALAIYLWHG